MISAPNSRVDYHKVAWDSERRSGSPRSSIGAGEKNWREPNWLQAGRQRWNIVRAILITFCCTSGEADSGYCRRVSKSVESTHRNNKTFSRQCYANGLNGSRTKSSQALKDRESLVKLVEKMFNVWEMCIWSRGLPILLFFLAKKPQKRLFLLFEW